MAESLIPDKAIEGPGMIVRHYRAQSESAALQMMAADPVPDHELVTRSWEGAKTGIAIVALILAAIAGYLAIGGAGAFVVLIAGLFVVMSMRGTLTVVYRSKQPGS